MQLKFLTSLVVAIDVNKTKFLRPRPRPKKVQNDKTKTTTDHWK